MNINLDLYDFPKLYTNQGHMSKLASAAGGSTLLSKEELNLLPDSDFALVIKEGAASVRKFPVVDKAHAYVSSIMFNETKGQLPGSVQNKVAANLVRSMAGNAITDNVVEKTALDKAVKVAAIAESTAHRASLNNEDFALVIKTAGQVRRLYPINTEELCEKAASYFKNNYKQIPVDFRHKFAFALTNKVASENFSVSLPDEIHSYYSKSFSPMVEAGIISRKLSTKEASVKDAYDLLLKQYKKAPPIKVAHLLRDLDKIAGLTESRHFKDAYATVFGKTVTEKKANDVTIVGKYQFDPNTLSTMPYDAFSNVLSQSDYTDLQADPVNNFNALPTMYQDQIANIASPQQ